MAITIGVGLTVMVNVSGAPEQEPISGVTVIVAVSVILFGVAVVKVNILPVPLAASPIFVLSLVQLYVVPAVPVKI